MTGSLASFSVAFCLVAGVFSSASVSAQIQLNRPSIESEKPGSTDVLQTQALEAPHPSAKALSPNKVAPRPLEDEGILVNQLSSIDPDANGLLSENEGGFPPNFWEGTEWAFVNALMPRMPASSSSAAVRALSERLLVSQAAVPENKPVDTSFISLRVNRLLAMGNVDQALSLLNLVSEERMNEDLSRIKIEATFFNNDNAGACDAVQKAQGKYAGFYWSQAQAFCLALSGDHSRAALIADLIRERDDAIEPAFFTAIDALAGAREQGVAALKSPMALHLAMLRAAKLQVPAEILEIGTVAVLRAVALSPNAELEVRLVAAEMAHRAGALSNEQILRLYTGIPFSRKELNTPLSVAAESWGARSRALILRSAAAQRVPLARAEVLRQGWQLARENKGYLNIVGPSVPLTLELDPAAELNWFAGDAARVLFAGGEIEKAMDWYNVVVSERQISEEARAAEEMLWPLALLVENSNAGSFDDKRLKAWYVAMQQSDPQSSAKKAQVLFALLAALGRPVPAKVQQLMVYTTFSGDDTGLNVAWQNGVNRATESRLLGEAVLLAVVGAGESADGILKLGDALRVIAALRVIGLERDAKLLAIETALFAGL